jgi:putative ABC transport system permease protein
MFQNYLKIAVRNLLKHKGYSFINIVGLAIGLSCCFLIVLFVRHELRFDRFHEKSERIYRLLHASKDDPNARSAISASAYAPHMLADFPEIEQAVRFFTNAGPANLKVGSEARTVDNFVFADGSVFDVFTFPLRLGDPASALQAPNTVVLTEASAREWFGEENPVGKVITYLRGNQKFDLQVTGVLENIPSTSHLQFDYLVSFTTIPPFMGENALAEYINFNYYTYFLLRDNIAPEQITARSTEFIRKHRGEDDAQQTLLVLQPITDIHLTTDVRWDVGSNSDPRYLYIFGGVAALILIIAAINFVNLSTARAAMRAKEVGVRKAVGAYRRQLILQLFCESVLASLLAMVLALALLLELAPLARNVLGRNIDFNFISNLPVLLLLLSIGLFTGVLAGIYPALVLSAFNPATVLKGLVTRGVKGAKLRKGLIVAQFGISVFLLIVMVSVYQQLNYMRTRDLGFDKEQVVVVRLSGPVKEHFDAFRNGLLSNSNIQNVALGTLPGRVGTSRGYNWPGKEEQESRSFYTMFVDQNMAKTLGLELAAGRDFSDAITTDATNAYLLNETAVRELGWENPVGRPFKVWDEEMGEVIGVVKDFHFRSLHNKIDPLVLDIKREWSWNAAVRIGAGDVQSTLSFIGDKWKALDPEVPFDYFFLDADFDRLYRSEQRLGQLFSGFTVLAIFVACLGLFGLAAFATEQRSKEIGIRKVLGATVQDILVLFSTEFTRLVILAIVVASPFAYLALRSWLENFAYRIDPGVTQFVLSSALVLLVAILTVSYQALKAALANPVKSLRYE